VIIVKEKIVHFSDDTVLNADNLALVTDLTSGFSQEEASRLGFDLVTFPVSYNHDGRVIEYEGGNEEPDDFYAQLADEKTTGAKTGSSIKDFIRIFESRLEESRLVVYLGASESLSEGMRNSALTAQQTLCEQHPGLDAEENVLVLQTHCIAGGLGLSLRMLRAWLNKKPRTVKELKDKVGFFGDHMAHMFTLFSYGYMKRSGRFASTAQKLKIGLVNTLGLYNVMISPRVGKLQPNWKTVRGEKHLLKAFVDIYAQDAIDPENGTVEIDYSGPSNEGFVAYRKAHELCAMLKERFPNVKIILAQTSPSVGCHVGPDEISFFFLQKNVRENIE